jgi:large subunit ribosomal protein L4
MPTIDVYSTSARKLKKMTLPRQIFGAKVNPPLMAQAVRVYLGNQRQAPAKTLRRGEISLSGRKIYRQKGTGRARHGDKKAPIFVKGAKAHGPTGEQNFKLKMSKQMRKQALFSALTSKLKEKEVMVISGLEKIKPKTKEMAKIIQNLKIKNQNGEVKGKITFVLPQVLENVLRAGRNIPAVNLKQAKQLNTYGVLNGGLLIFMKESIGVLKETFLQNQTSKTKNKKHILKNKKTIKT